MGLAVQDFVVRQVQQLKSYGLTIPNDYSGNPPVAGFLDHLTSVEAVMKEAFVNAQQMFGCPPAIIFVLLPSPSQGVDLALTL